MHKSTFFKANTTLNVDGKLLDLSIPVIMGILNVTPDSFFDGGRYEQKANLLKQAEKLLQEGATIIDVGGMSSRPGAAIIEDSEELKRVIPAITAIKNEFPGAIISIDTVKSTIAKAAVEAGAGIVNDISGGQIDPFLLETVAQLKVPYILMHMRGTPKTMTKKTAYEDLIGEIQQYFVEKQAQLKKLGIKDVILDLGFGFSKNVAQNFQLLESLDQFHIFEWPILVGISRKSMIWRTLKTDSTQALNGTTVLNTIALLKGAKILRVHDVKEAMETITLLKQMND